MLLDDLFSGFKEVGGSYRSTDDGRDMLKIKVGVNIHMPLPVCVRCHLRTSHTVVLEIDYEHISPQFHECGRMEHDRHCEEIVPPGLVCFFDTNLCPAPTVPEIWEEIASVFPSEEEEEPTPDHDTYINNCNSFLVPIISPPFDSEVDKAHEQVMSIHNCQVSTEALLQTMKPKAINW